MTADEVRQLVDHDIQGNWPPTMNWHGIQLDRCLLAQPELRTYRDSFSEGEVVQLWLVLQEVPGDESSYQVIFDEDRGDFGLAIGGVFIGFYGSFVQTVAGM
jgi:hypothetical protein